MTGSPLMLLVLAVMPRLLGGFFACGLAMTLGVRAAAAIAVAILYAVAGARTGMLAAAGLPLLLLGVERARGRGGVAVALAIAMILVSRLPGAAAVDLTLAGAWALLRLTLSPGGWDSRMSTRLAVGALAGASIGTALSWSLSIAPAEILAPPPSAIVAWAAVIASALATFLARGQRAIRGLLLTWVLLDAGRAFGVPLASFLLDIAAPMSDAGFVAAAMPSLVLACLLLATLAWPEMRWRRVAVAVALATVIIGVLDQRPAPETLVAVADGDVAHTTPLALAPGESVAAIIPAAIVRDGAVRRIGVEIGTYLGAADGTLALSLCAGSRCETGTAGLRAAADNAVLFATLPHDLPTRAGEDLRWRATHVGGTSGVAVWLAPSPGGRLIEGPSGPIPDMSAHVELDYVQDHRAFAPRGP